MLLKGKRSKARVISVKWHATIAKKKAILQINTPSQKTSVGLSNLYTSGQ